MYYPYGPVHYDSVEQAWVMIGFVGVFFLFLIYVVFFHDDDDDDTPNPTSSYRN